MTRRVHNFRQYALISCTVILHVIDVRFMQGYWNTSGLWTAVDAYCISFVTANRLQTKNWVSVNVNVQGSGIRWGIIKPNLVSTSSCDKCSSEKPPHETVLSWDRSTFAEEQKAEVVGYLSCWKFYSFLCNALNHLFCVRFSAKYLKI